MALITFNKRPGLKYLAKRRVSFAAVGEVDHVRDADDITLNVGARTSTTVVEMSGKEFLSKLQVKQAKDGTKIFTLEF